MHIYQTFPFFQLLFVLFAYIHLQTQVQSKPYKSQVEEQKFTELQHELTQAMQNETSSIRAKRGVIYNLTDFCSGASNLPSQSSYGCVKGWYSCYNYAEAVCNRRSFHCLSNVGQYGFPKCTPDFEFVTIDLGMSRGKIKVRRTKGCHCAQWQGN